MLVTWRREKFVYLEYFAVDASLRGQGAGQRILEELRDAFPHKVILEIDPPEDGISRRRLGFIRGTALSPILNLIISILLIRMRVNLSRSC